MTGDVSPLTPADCDLRDYRFMPLDVVRLRDSEAAGMENAEAFRCSLLAWCVSWHQVPAASLPDDDHQLCRMLGYGRDVTGFRELRVAGALRGFVKCSDGRLYHPVVAEKATEAWEKKQKWRTRSQAANAARWGAQKPDGDGGGSREQTKKEDSPTPTRTELASNKDGFCVQKGESAQSQGKGQGQGEGIEGASLPLFAEPAKPARARPKPRDAEPDGFAEWYDAYPRHEKRAEAAKAYVRACAKAGGRERLLALTKAHRFNPDTRYVPHPTSWLNGERWSDQPPPEPEGGAGRVVTFPVSRPGAAADPEPQRGTNQHIEWRRRQWLAAAAARQGGIPAARGETIEGEAEAMEARA